MSVIEDVENYFGAYRPPEKREEWEEVKRCLAIGATVQGTVTGKYEFGVWLDVGVGFPALLLVPNFESPDNRRFTFPDDYPDKGRPSLV